MSHLLKLFLKIIYSENFQNIGTRKAIFSLQVLLQRARDVNVTVHALLIIKWHSIM